MNRLEELQKAILATEERQRIEHARLLGEALRSHKDGNEERAAEYFMRAEVMRSCILDTELLRIEVEEPEMTDSALVA